MSVPAPSASPLVRRYTIEEFFALDAPPPGSGHYELIAGVLYMVPPPESPHDRAVSNLIESFARYVLQHPGQCKLFVPRAAIWTPSGTYLEPDLFLVTAEQLATWERTGRHTTGGLVVEVTSPGSAVYDRTAKADTYAALGVLELWIVTPERATIEQRVLRDGAWGDVTVYTGSATCQSAVFAGVAATPAAVCRA